MAVRLRLDAAAIATFPTFIGRRFMLDNCLGVAASLSYTSLLALVPLLTIALALLSAFPVFENIEVTIRSHVLSVMMPNATSQFEGHVNAFIRNARQLTGVGIAVLGLTAVMLLVTVEDAFNRIWRLKRKRRFLFRIVIYWSIITLAPLMVAASVSLTGQAQAVLGMLGIGSVSDAASFVPSALWKQIVPLTLQFGVFTVIFIVLPNKRVEFWHAAAGAIVAATLFQGLKYGFGLYVRGGPATTTIYGALATVPIFLVWMYSSWAVILLGAEVAAGVADWRLDRVAGRDGASREAHLLARAVAVLGALRDAFRAGRTAHTVEVAETSGLSRGVTEMTLETLHDVGWTTRLGNGRWQPGRDLSAVTVYDLCTALGLALPHDAAEKLGTDRAWQGLLAPALAEARQAAERALGMTVAALLDGKRETG